VNFASIIGDTKRPVLAAIRRYLDARFAYAVDDVAQEVYLRAYRALAANKLKDSSKLRAYLYTIARNEALRMSARLGREEKKLESFVENERRRLTIYEPEEDSIPFLAERVRLELKHLPAHYADVVQLVLLGLTAREIVQRLEIKPGTVKSRLSRGLAILRERIT
jgi:RNA polymerase sigma-70 factor, ECF subfamily